MGSTNLFPSKKATLSISMPTPLSMYAPWSLNDQTDKRKTFVFAPYQIIYELWNSIPKYLSNTNL